MGIGQICQSREQNRLGGTILEILTASELIGKELSVFRPATKRKNWRLFADDSTKFIRMLPWAVSGENDGKGPFEVDLFQAPDFRIVHCDPGVLYRYGLGGCKSAQCELLIRIERTKNLEKMRYSDIRETYGLKNVVFANPAPSVSKVEKFRGCNHVIRFIVTAIHELLGHGTEKLRIENAAGESNFDKSNPPINPIPPKPVDTWHNPGQTWKSVFEKLSTFVEE
ncbi:MAG: hypothetical protein M1820_007108 [Bogoriella megaspora]|nr:MAG: hypothetical protein M1820_007108 [Bogoriella megaspora]